MNEADLFAEVSSVQEDRKILIKKLAVLYSAVLTSNYTQDLLKELSYTMSLLRAKLQNDETSPTKSQDSIILEDGRKISLFESNGEGIYFAALVLQQQWNLLKQLNTATLSILAELFIKLIPEFADQIFKHVEKVRENDRTQILNNF